jgi:hypothetical protein
VAEPEAMEVGETEEPESRGLVTSGSRRYGGSGPQSLYRPRPRVKACLAC